MANDVIKLPFENAEGSIREIGLKLRPSSRRVRDVLRDLKLKSEKELLELDEAYPELMNVIKMPDSTPEEKAAQEEAFTRKLREDSNEKSELTAKVLDEYFINSFQAVVEKNSVNDKDRALIFEAWDGEFYSASADMEVVESTVIAFRSRNRC